MNVGRPILAAAAFLRGASWLKTIARAILVGWITLLPLVYLLERPLLISMARTLSPSWFPTFRLALDCSLLAATGWVIGRFGAAGPTAAVIVFAATLSIQTLGELVEIRVPWLFQLAVDALHDRHYWDSLFDTTVTQTFLFGSLFVGARLSRRAEAPPSIAGPD